MLIAAVTGISLAFFNYTRTGNANTFQTGRIYFSTGQSNTITLTNVFPINESDLAEDVGNHGTVTVTLVGDTEYTRGIEYLVTLDQVNNTINGKSIPIKFSATVTGIGTSSNDYWNARGGNTSIYELTPSGIVYEDKYVLVGYITEGQTGINGNIQISAYLDASKIAITDTPEESADWINGRTVFSTAEWNTFRTTPVSFKVRVEANEGIWVEEPGRIETCPNCKFIYTTNELLTTWNTESETPTELTSGYSTNYNDIVTSSGKSYFLGVVTNASNQITNAYACGLKGGTTPFCIEGTSDGSNYSSNSSLLNGASLWNNTCTVGANSTECGSWNGSSVSARAFSGGYVIAGVSRGDYCYVDPDGYAICSEFPSGGDR